jgi:hypothetical protein
MTFEGNENFKKLVFADLEGNILQVCLLSLESLIRHFDFNLSWFKV